MSDEALKQEVAKLATSFSVLVDRYLGLACMAVAATIGSGHSAEFAVMGAAMYLGSFLRGRQ